MSAEATHPSRMNESLCFSFLRKVHSSDQREAKRGHLFPVADKQGVTCKHRVIPRFALDGGHARELREFVSGCRNQRELAFFRSHQQQILIRQEQQLPVAVAAALPFALAVSEIDAGENGPVEAERMAVVNDEVVEVR